MDPNKRLGGTTDERRWFPYAADACAAPAQQPCSLLTDHGYYEETEMQLTILACEQRTGGVVAVRFRTNIGDGEATWSSRRVLPVEGANYTVELDVDGVIELGRTATVTDAGRYSLSRQGDQIFMAGLVEDVDSDGIVYFRLALDCLFMVQSCPGHATRGDWLKLTIPWNSLRVTPLGG